MRNIKKLPGAIVALAVALSLWAGCTQTNTKASDPEDAAKIANSPEAATIEEATYPNLAVEITSDETRIYEHMDYCFIPDDEVLGKWEVVDFVRGVEYFDPADPFWAFSDLYFKSVKFDENGKASLQFAENMVAQKWTKGYLLDNVDETVPAYAVKQIGGANYIFIEWKTGDYIFQGRKPWYYVFKKASDPEPAKDGRYVIRPFEDVRATPYATVVDFSNIDLSDFGENIRTLWFNEKTLFPPKVKMPQKSELWPENIMEAGKNPGLGVRFLHGRGITGKGVNVAIIDQPLYIDSHPEYAGKIIEYRDFDCQSESSMHGPGVTGLLAGETMGTAPGAKIYYAAVPSWKADAKYFAEALDWIVETNKTLPEGEKIRVVSLSGSPTPSDPRYINGEIYLESVERATKAGILVLDCSPENGIVGSCEYNLDSPEDVALCKFVNLSGNYPFDINSTVKILAPVNYRTTAEEYIKGEFSYMYTGQGGWSWAIPYAAGVLAMGWEVKAELAPDEMVQILFDTAYVGEDGHRYIYPAAFIEYLQDNG